MDITDFEITANELPFDDFSTFLSSLELCKFYHQLMHKRTALKGVLKFTLKQLQHVVHHHQRAHYLSLLSYSYCYSFNNCNFSQLE